MKYFITETSYDKNWAMINTTKEITLDELSKLASYHEKDSHYQIQNELTLYYADEEIMKFHLKRINHASF